MFNKNVPQRLRWAIAAIGMLATQNALADFVAEFYHGKTLSLVVSTTTGTSYDLMGRTLARYLSKHIPGNSCHYCAKHARSRRHRRRELHV